MNFNKKINIIIQVCIAIMFFVIAFFINKIPYNFFIEGGDFYQVLNPMAHLSRYFYAWFNQTGQGAFNTLSMTFPYYSMLSLLDFIGLKSGIIASFQMFFFLYSSYLSLFFSIKILFPKLKNEIRMLSSLLYSLNNFTFTLFLYPWGFTHHVLFYIFIPLLVFPFISILLKKEFVLRDFVFFTLFFLLSTVSYNNIAFFVALLLVQFIIFVLLCILGQFKFDFTLIKKVLVFALIYIVGTFYFLLPFYLSNSEYQGKIMNTASFGGDVLNIVKITSNNILNIFQLDINGFNSQPNLLNILYPLILSVLLFLYLWRNKNKGKNLVIIIFLSLFLIFTFFAVRLHEPFYFLNLLFFKSPFFSLFRSPDKIFIFFPLFYVTLFTALLNQLNLKRIYLYLLFFVLLLIPYKFYIGGVINALNKNDGTTSEYYRYVEKIPDEYYQVRDIVNKDNLNQSVISLPYSMVNSLNWSNYPKWHFIGQDILHLLYNKNYISANTFDHANLETKLSFKDFNDNPGSSDKLLQIIEKFSGQFIFFHKDITADWIAKSAITSNALKVLQKNKQIDLVASNDFFDLYELKKENLVPLINSDTTEFFKRINPTKYKVYINLKNASSLIFNQSYNKEWGLYLNQNPKDSWCQKLQLYNNNGNSVTECQSNQRFFEGEELSYLYKKSIFDNTHQLINDYANQWTIDSDYIKKNFDTSYYKENPDGSIDVELTLYFKPQSYFYLGLIISGTTLLSCLGYLGWDFVRRRKRKGKEISTLTDKI